MTEIEKRAYAVSVKNGWVNEEIQTSKLVEEVIEFVQCKTDIDKADEIGDILFVLNEKAQRLGVTLLDCLEFSVLKNEKRLTDKNYLR